MKVLFRSIALTALPLAAAVSVRRAPARGLDTQDDSAEANANRAALLEEGAARVRLALGHNAHSGFPSPVRPLPPGKGDYTAQMRQKVKVKVHLGARKTLKHGALPEASKKNIFLLGDELMVADVKALFRATANHGTYPHDVTALVANGKKAHEVEGGTEEKRGESGGAWTGGIARVINKALRGRASKSGSSESETAVDHVGAGHVKYDIEKPKVDDAEKPTRESIDAAIQKRDADIQKRDQDEFDEQTGQKKPGVGWCVFPALVIGGIMLPTACDYVNSQRWIHRAERVCALPQDTCLYQHYHFGSEWDAPIEMWHMPAAAFGK